MNKLRRAEIAAHAGSFFAVLTTLIMVGTAQVAESNPVAAWLIAHGGISTWALATPILLGGGFALCRWAYQEGEQRLATGSGIFLAAALWLDSIGNVLVIAVRGLPDSLRLLELATTALLLAGLALVVIVRPRIRAWAGILVHAIREVTVRLSAVEREQVAAGALGVMLVLSSLGGVVGPLNSTTPASAVVENATYVDSFDVSTEDSAPVAVEFNADGTKMYVLGATNDNIYEYSLSTAWDATTGSFENSFSVTDGSGGIEVNDDGTQLFVENGGTITEYSISNGNVSTASQTNTFDISTEISDVREIEFSGDGTNLLVLDTGNSNFDTWSLSTGYDLSTRSHNGQHDISGESGNPAGIAVNGDGTKVLVSDQIDDKLYEYSLSTGWDASSASYSSTSLGVSTNAGQPDGVAIGDKGSQMYVASGANDDIVSYSTDFSGYGVKVSGTFTDGDGNAIDGATAELRQSGSVVQSTSSNSSGGYSFSGVSDGDYTVRASASGYQNASKSITISGSPRSVNLTLGGNLQGTVRTTQEAACGGCTVELWMANDANTTTDAGETVQEAQEDTFKTISRAVPRDLFSREVKLLNGDKFTDSGKQVLIHDPDAWYNEGTIADRVKEYPGSAGTSDLSTPVVQLEPQTKYAFSVWDRSRQPALEDGVDSKINPGVSTDGTIVVEQIGPGNSTISRVEKDTGDFVKTGITGNVKTHEAYIMSLPEGYYRVYPESSGVPYVVRVGQPEKIPRTIHKDLEDVDNKTADISKTVQDKIDNGELKRVTTETGPDGDFSYAVPDGYTTVAITVFDGKGLTDDITDPTLSDLRSEIKRQDYNGSIYMSRSPKVVTPPATDVEVTVVELTNPTLGDLAGYFDQLEWLEDLVNREDFAELNHLFLDPIGGSEWLPESEGSAKDKLLDTRDNLADVVQGNDELLSRYEELAEERGIPTDLNADELTQEELKAQLDLLNEVTSERQSEVDGDQTPGSTGSTDPQVDTSPASDGDGGQTTVDAGDTTVNVEIPTGTNLNESSDAQSVVCQKPDGSSRVLNDSATTIDSGLTGDTVLLEDVIGNETAGCNYVIMAPGEEGGVVREEVRVENPAFDGTIPALDSINVNTMRPGPEESVVVTVSPAETSSFKSLQGAEVFGPDGNSLSTNVTGDKLRFTTNGAGSHLVKLNVTDGNRAYVESFRLKAGNSSTSYPASVRVLNGVLGKSVIAGDGVESGRISADDGGQSARITAAVDGQDVPNEIHVHARDLSGTQQRVTLAVVKESDDSRVSKPLQVKMHLSRLNDGAHVRINGHPITSSGNSWGKIEQFGSSTLITTTLRDGTVEASVNNNPTVFDEIGWQVDRLIAFLNPLSIFSGFGSAGGTAGGGSSSTVAASVAPRVTAPSTGVVA